MEYIFLYTINIHNCSIPNRPQRTAGLYIYFAAKTVITSSALNERTMLIYVLLRCYPSESVSERKIYIKTCVRLSYHKLPKP